MKILVTGATGFIGTALVNKLTDVGRFAVRAAVRRAEPVQISPEVEPVVVGDIDGATAWKPALIDVNCVVHLAARVHVMRDVAADSLSEYRQTNVLGTLNLARQAAAASVHRFIFMSTIKVNGEGTSFGRPYHPDDLPAPADPYAVSKLEAEEGLRELTRAAGMELIVIRPPLVYGPGVKGNVLTLLNWIARGLPLPFANVDNRRSLIHVKNLVDFIVLCAEHPSAASQTFLVSDGEDLATRDLVLHLAAAMARSVRLFPIPLRPSRFVLKALGRDDLWQRLFGSLQVNSDKAKHLLGWDVPVRVRSGLEELGRWYIAHRAVRT